MRRLVIVIGALSLGCSRPGSQADSTTALAVDTVKPLTGAVVTSPDSTTAAGTTSGTNAGTKAATPAAPTTKATGTKSSTTAAKTADTTRPTVRDSVVRNARRVRIPPDTTKKPPQ